MRHARPRTRENEVLERLATRRVRVDEENARAFKAALTRSTPKSAGRRRSQHVFQGGEEMAPERARRVGGKIGQVRNDGVQASRALMPPLRWSPRASAIDKPRYTGTEGSSLHRFALREVRERELKWPPATPSRHPVGRVETRLDRASQVESD